MQLNHDPTRTPPSTATSPRRFPRASWVLLVAGILVASALAVGLGVSYLNEQKQLTGPISVVDDAGRNVTLPGPATRIVVLQPSAMDIVYRLGIRDRVVGVDCGTPSAGGVAADYTPGQIQNWSLASLPCVTWIPNLDIPVLVALQPDLVLAGPGINVASLDTITQQYGIATAYLNPTTLSGISYDVEMVGTLTGTGSAAAGLVNQMAESLAIDRSVVENLTQEPRVFLTYYLDSGGYYSFGPGTFGNDLIQLAGAVSITGNDSAANVNEVSGSYILAADPSIIVVGVGFGLNVSSYSSGPDWSSFPAVQSGHVDPIDASLISEPDPSMVFSVALLIHMFHPSVTVPSAHLGEGPGST